MKKFFAMLVLLVLAGCHMEDVAKVPEQHVHVAAEFGGTEQWVDPAAAITGIPAPVIDKTCGAWRLAVEHELKADEYIVQRYVCDSWASFSRWETQASSSREAEARKIYERAISYYGKEVEVLATTVDSISCSAR